MRMSRHLDAKEFLEEAKKLRATRGHLSLTVLERLEEQRSLVPKLRLRYPDAIERRWWARAYPEYNVSGKLEPEGRRWKAACALEKARQRHVGDVDPTTLVHPFDSPGPEFRRFLQRPARRKFVPWQDFDVKVGDGSEGPICTSETQITYYSAWQLLLFAEVVDMGVQVHLNLVKTGCFPSPDVIAAAPGIVSFYPFHAIHGFAKHERALDAIVWFAEEAQSGYMYATRHDHRRRMLDDSERDEIMRTRLWAAREARRRYKVGFSALLEATKFLCEQWADWHREGRPLIADAYKSVLAQAVRLSCFAGGIEYPELRDKIGRARGYLKPILDVIWTDWAVEQRDDLRRILVSYSRPNALVRAPFTAELVDRFLDFVEASNLHGLYWRMESFHRHSFKGNDHALEGLKGDVQGMAVVLEHISSALGAKKPQLREKFKELWANNAAVLKGLKNNAVMKVGDGTFIDMEWFEGRQALGPVQETCADLAISYAIRGGAHRVIEEENPLKLERMMLILLRAAVKTFDAATRDKVDASTTPSPSWGEGGARREAVGG